MMCNLIYFLFLLCLNQCTKPTMHTTDQTDSKNRLNRLKCRFKHNNLLWRIEVPSQLLTRNIYNSINLISVLITQHLKVTVLAPSTLVMLTTSGVTKLPRIPVSNSPRGTGSCRSWWRAGPITVREFRQMNSTHTGLRWGPHELAL